MRGLRDGIAALGIAVRADPLMRFTSSLLAAAALVLIVMVLRDRFAVDEGTALLTAVGLGTSYGFWRYASESDVYALTNVTTLAALYVGLRRPLDRRWQLAAIAVGVVAVAANFFNVLPVIVVVGGGYLVHRERRAAALHVLAVVAIVGISIVALYGAARGPDATFTSFYTENTGSLVPSPKDFARAPVGFGQNVAAGNFFFGISPVADALEDAFPAKDLREEQYAADHTPSLVIVGGVLTALLLVGVTLAVAIDSRRGVGARLVRRDLLPTLAWLAILAWFLTGAVPGDPEAWVLLLVPAWILFARAIALGLTHRRLAIALVAALAAHNLVGGLLLVRDAKFDLNVVRGSWLAQATTPRDLVLSTSPTFARWMRYEGDAPVVDLSGYHRPEADRAVLALPRPGQRVFATEDLFDPPPHIAERSPDLSAALAAHARELCRRARVVHTGPEVEVSELGAPGRPGKRPRGC